jgi:putative transcriptional regulator
MNKFSKELIESLAEACEHAEGKPSGIRVHAVEVPDVRAIRRQLRMSQQEFARVYRIPLATLKNWEQGRRQPPPISKSSPCTRARRGRRWRLEGGARVLRRPFALHDRDHRQLLVLSFRRSRESGNPELRDLVARPWALAFAGVTEKIM